MQIQKNPAPAGKQFLDRSIYFLGPKAPQLPARDCWKSGILRSGDAVNFLSDSKSNLLHGGRECLQSQNNLAPAGKQFLDRSIYFLSLKAPQLPARDCWKNGILRSGDAVNFLSCYKRYLIHK